MDKEEIRKKWPLVVYGKLDRKWEKWRGWVSVKSKAFSDTPKCL